MAKGYWTEEDLENRLGLYPSVLVECRNRGILNPDVGTDLYSSQQINEFFDRYMDFVLNLGSEYNEKEKYCFSVCAYLRKLGADVFDKWEDIKRAEQSYEKFLTVKESPKTILFTLLLGSPQREVIEYAD